MRFAINILAPILAYSNFVLIAFNLTDLKNTMPFEIFVIIFTIGMSLVLFIIGMLFRKKQLETDITMAFERSVPAMRSTRIMYDEQELLHKGMNRILKEMKLEEIPEQLDFVEWKEYIRKIEERKI